MKTTLLFYGVALLLTGCADAPELSAGENLSDEEMKSLAEVEEITFEKASENPVAAIEIDPINPEIVDPIYPGCILEPGMLGGDIVEPPPLPPEPIGCPRFPTEDDGICDFPEEEAQFPGGVAELKKYIHQNLSYPNADIDSQGRVYVTMIIGEDGAIRDAEIMRGGISEELNQEALRVIRSMPKWIPAKDHGKIVAARVRLPISFTLN